MSHAGTTAYAHAGVSLTAADAVAEHFSASLAPADGSRRMQLAGGYAGGIQLPGGLVLAASCDGAGTKIDLLREHGALIDAGIDIVAMCANDLACTGVAPAMFVDYVAVHQLEPDEVAALVGGIQIGCVQAGCELVGGETAELGGMLAPGCVDGAGTCIGVASADSLVDTRAVEAGDVVIGLASTGPHANGYTLVRDLIARGALTPSQDLLAPTRIYVQVLAALRSAGVARAAAHITGGGIPGNLPRILPPGCGVVIDRATWFPDAVFSEIASAAQLELFDLVEVFNLGMGMAIITPAEAADEALSAIAASGIRGWVAGEVREHSGSDRVAWEGAWPR